MSASDRDRLLDDLRRYQLLEPVQLESLAVGDAADAHALARHLLRCGWLTAYQANQLLRGRGASLVLGQYQLLERLGEGGMGQVFKARHLGLQRVVALKRLPRGVEGGLAERFRREVRALSQLNHPNIVQALDADELGGELFFVMEHVDGIDLSRLVKSQGPLPVAEACDYVRQAALGLQHLHERGLVHRDVKPSNLLLNQAHGAPPGQRVKILDLGLARLRVARVDEDGAALTHAGTVIGTPDYLAPEQALDAHAVDVRADLYSLGCTLYFLLTAQPPFSGGSPLEKLFQHRLQTAPSVDRIRPDVPRWLAGVVSRLMAKRPEQRYQTAAELVPDLAAARTASTAPVSLAAGVTTVTLRGVQTVLTQFEPSGDSSASRNPAPWSRPAARFRWTAWFAGGARRLAGLPAWLLARRRSLRGG